jgi:hypothetical protein
MRCVAAAIGQPVTTLVLHVVFGLVIGGICGLLNAKLGSIARHPR